MPARKSPKEKLAELQEQEDAIRRQLQARLNRVRGEIKSTRQKLTKEERRRDARRKIIAGALALEHAEINAEFGAELWRLLSRQVTRPDDRALLGLEPLPGDEPQPELRASDQFSAAG